MTSKSLGFDRVIEECGEIFNRIGSKVQSSLGERY